MIETCYLVNFEFGRPTFQRHFQNYSQIEILQYISLIKTLLKNIYLKLIFNFEMRETRVAVLSLTVFVNVECRWKNRNDSHELRPIVFFEPFFYCKNGTNQMCKSI